MSNKCTSCGTGEELSQWKFYTWIWYCPRCLMAAGVNVDHPIDTDGWLRLALTV